MASVNRRHLVEGLDLAMMTFWFFAASSQFPYTSILLMAGLAYFAIRIAFHWKTVFRAFTSRFSIWLIPALAVLSTVWSTDSAFTLRSGLQLTATALIACYFATRLKLWQVIASLGVAATIILLMNLQGVLTSGDGQMFRGGFDQKNFFASRVTPALLVAATFLAYVRMRLRLALIVLPILAAIAFFAALSIIRAESVTAMIAATLTVLTIIATWMLTSRSVAVRGLFLSAAVAIAAAGAVGYVTVVKQDPIDLVLESFGKDRSLTGRTQIWAAAERAISDRPIVGHGYQAFWWSRAGALVKQRQLVRPDQPFYFHNTFLEHTVSLGYLGLVAVIACIAQMVWLITRAVFARADAVTAFFLGLSVYMLLRALVEVDLFRPFEPLQTMFWVAAAALPAYAAQRSKRAPAVAAPGLDPLPTAGLRKTV